MICVLSGGNWNNGGIAGVCCADLNNYRSNSNNTVGFRADCGSPSYSARKQWGNRDVVSCVTRNRITPFFPVGQPKARRVVL